MKLSNIPHFVLEKSTVLEVVFYQSNQDLLEQMGKGGTPFVVCPSPQIADNLRSLIPQLDVVTISKWTADHLKKLGLKRSRKSELMVKFAAIWKNYFPLEKTSIFLESFELFTELRSFTLDLNLLGEFFKELDEVVVKSILIFWTYLDQEKIIDEHLGYKRTAEIVEHESMWFVGFKHMSGVQIDMLKILSENLEVKIFFPNPVFLETLPNDWIRWLAEPSTEALRIKKSEDTEANLKIATQFIPRGKANVILKEFFNLYPNHDLLLASTQTGIISFQETQTERSFFKASEDLFAMDRQWLIEDLRKKIGKRKFFLEEVQNYLIELKEKCIGVGKYRQYKIVDLAEEALQAYGEFQTEIDIFGIDILEITIGLNSPRTSVLSLEKIVSRTFFDMNDLVLRDEKKPVAILVTKNMGSFRSNEKALSEAMIKALKAIGPIKRAGLEFLFYKYELSSLLEKKDSILLIEEQLLEMDLSWREILKKFQTDSPKLKIEYSIKENREYLLPKMKKGPFTQTKISASKIQSFIDCPQKFYFSYIDKIDNRPSERASLGPDELGNLEHKIIACYFESEENLGDDINLVLHQKICIEELEKFLSIGRLVLNQTEYARSYNELMHYTWNGISFLIDLMNEKGSRKKIKFEVPLGDNPWNINGFIDCIIEGEDGKISIVDFKRSGNSMGTKAETVEFRKIQIWVYLMVLNNQGYSIDSFGYLNLSDLDDNKLFFTREDAQEILASSLEKVSGIIESVILNMQTMNLLKANPRDVKVCHYCPVNLFCLKGEEL